MLMRVKVVYDEKIDLKRLNWHPRLAWPEIVENILMRKKVRSLNIQLIIDYGVSGTLVDQEVNLPKRWQHPFQAIFFSIFFKQKFAPCFSKMCIGMHVGTCLFNIFPITCHNGSFILEFSELTKIMFF